MNYIDPTGHCRWEWSWSNARSCGSAAVGFIPVVGDIKDAQEVLTGTDLVAGEDLGWGDRLLTVGAALIPIVSGKLAREGVEHADDIVKSGIVQDVLGKIKGWLEDGFTVGRNKFGDLWAESKDGLRKFRIDFNHPNPHESPHAHLEVWDRSVGKKGDWVPFDPSNAQIYPVDVPHE